MVAVSPLILLASLMSLVMMVALPAWMAHKLVSSKSPIMWLSTQFWIALTAASLYLASGKILAVISLMTLRRAAFGKRRLVLLWYILMSLRALIPGLYFLLVGSVSC